MKNLLVIGLIGMAVGAQASPVVFYGGDENGVSDIACQINGMGFVDSRVYDNFTLGSAMNIDGVFGNFADFSSGNATGLYWEIRSGVSLNNGGTLLFSGTNAFSRTGSGTDFNYSAGFSAFTLGPGSYWLTVAVDGGDNQTFIKTTGGVNGVGGPLADGNSFWDSSTFGQNFEDTSILLGSSGDFSIGLTGTDAVPEPASLAVLGLGAVALLRRRRK